MESCSFIEAGIFIQSLKVIIMKKILNKIAQVLQVVLSAPVKWPGKAGNILKYIAVGLGILETVMVEDKPPSEKPAADGAGHKLSDETPGATEPHVDNSELPTLSKERSEVDENQ